MKLDLPQSDDLLQVQGILASISNLQSEPLTNIHYKGGNEMKISHVINSLEQFLTKQGYITKRSYNKEQINPLNSIVTLLAVNVDIKNNEFLQTCDIQHLINPSHLLSKCLLANIVTELDLAASLAHAFEQLPLEVSAEILPEVVVCLKKCSSIKIRDHGYFYVKTIISLFHGRRDIVHRNNESCGQIQDAVAEIVQYMTQFNVDDRPEGMTKSKLFHHMGLLILRLCDLLLLSHGKEEYLYAIPSKLVDATCAIFRAVSVDIFIEWAEFDYEGNSLQVAVSNTAYKVLELYQKNKRAKELITMFAAIARKPAPLSDRIKLATTDQILKAIKSPSITSRERQEWLLALVNSNMFEDEGAFSDITLCLTTYGNLLDSDSIVRILGQAAGQANFKVRELALKCAALLSTDDLSISIIRHFRSNGVSANLKIPSTESNFMILMNKLNSQTTHVDCSSMCLLFLQDPIFVTQALLAECIKSSAHKSYMKEVFDKLCNSLSIENWADQELARCLQVSPPAEENIGNYVILINILRENGSVKAAEILLENYSRFQFNSRAPGLIWTLQLINSLEHLEYGNNFTSLIINILSQNRCKFFTLNQSKMGICKECVDILRKSRVSHKMEVTEESEGLLARINHYYFEYDAHISFLDSVFPSFSLDDYTSGVCKLLKLLPSCVFFEWTLVYDAIFSNHNTFVVMDVLSDVMVLLCQTAASQEKDSTIALQYCLSNYGFILKTKIIANHANDDAVINHLVKKIVHLLSELHPELDSLEGIKLITLLPQSCMIKLRTDRDILKSISELRNAELRKVITMQLKC